jgi:hypothetical protein
MRARRTRRARRSRHVCLCLTLAAGLAACGDDDHPTVDAAAPGDNVVAGVVDVDHASDAVLHVQGDTVELAAPARNGLTGGGVANVVPLNDGGFVYTTWDLLVDPARYEQPDGLVTGAPVAVASLRSTEDPDVVIDGAMTAAVRADGAFAFFRGATREYRHNERWTGHVVVRSDVTGTDEVRWSTDERAYQILAWAQDRLLVYLTYGDAKAPDLVVFDAPGQSRLLREDAQFLALDEQGTHVAVASGRPGGPTRVEILDVGTGEVVASTGSDADAPVVAVYTVGEWRGDRIVTAGVQQAADGAGFRQALLVYETSGATIRLATSMSFDQRQFPSLNETAFGDDSSVTAWSTDGVVTGTAQERPPMRLLWLGCDLEAQHCTAQHLASEARSVARVRQLSRPLPAGQEAWR